MQCGRGRPTQTALLLGCTCASWHLTSPAGRQGMRSGNCWGGVLRVDLELASGDLLQPARYATRDRLLAQVPWLRLLSCCQDMGGIARTARPISPSVHCWGGVPTRFATAELAPATWPVSKHVCSAAA